MQGLREFVDAGREIPRGAQAHVFYRVNPEADEVGVGDPVFVHAHEGKEGGGGSEVVWVVVPDGEVFEVEEVTVKEFGGVVPVLDLAFAREAGHGLELSRPDCGFGPGGGECFGVDGAHWDGGVAVGVVVACYFILASGIHRAAVLVCVDVGAVVENDIQQDIDAQTMGNPYKLAQIFPRSESRFDVEEVLHGISVIRLQLLHLLK